MTVTLNDLIANVIPDGKYQARFDEVEASETKKGDPQVQLEMTIVSGDYKGRSLRSWCMLTPTTIWKYAQNLKAMGAGDPGTRDYGYLIGDADAAVKEMEPFLNQVFTIQVRSRKYNDRLNNEFTVTTDTEDLDV